MIVVAAGIAVAGLAGSWSVLRARGGYQYRTAPASRGNLSLAISATGTPNAVVTVQVGSQVSGNIQALYADFNTRVQSGQLVARIDPAIFEARVNQAAASLDAARAAVVNAQAVIGKSQAEVASAEANLANARANVMKAQVEVRDDKLKYDRRVTLAREGVLSQEDLDTARATYDGATASLEASQAAEKAATDGVTAAKAQLEVARTQYASAQAQVKQNEAALRQAQTDLDHTYIRAPVDGTVVARRVDVGQTVAASLQAPTLFEIAQDLTKMQVDTNVSEADVGRVEVGQPTTFTVDAYPGEIFRGQVTAIRKAPINVQNVITYDVVIAVPNPDLKLFPGMTANVKILVGRRERVLKVANAALRFRPQNVAPEPAVQAASRGRRAAPEQKIWVLDSSGKPREVTVTTGATDGVSTEITGGGLHEGDAVIIAALPKGQSSFPTSAPATRPVGGSSFGRGRGF